MLSGSLCYQLSPKLQALPQIHTLAWSHTHTHTQTLNILSHTHTQRSSDTDTQSSGHSVVCVFVDFPLCLFKTEQFPRSFTPFLTTVAASQSIWHDFPVRRTFLYIPQNMEKFLFRLTIFLPTEVKGQPQLHCHRPRRWNTLSSQASSTCSNTSAVLSYLPEPLLSTGTNSWPRPVLIWCWINCWATVLLIHSVRVSSHGAVIGDSTGSLQSSDVTILQAQ